MYKVVVTAPDSCAEYIRAIIGQTHMGMPVISDDEERMEQIEFLCRVDRLQSVIEQIKDLETEEVDISMDIYKLGGMHD